jgi:hypothetical protein
VQLSGLFGDRFALTIVDYEFAGDAVKRGDADWLMIRIEVTSDGRTWHDQDPSLDTWEVESIIQWLEAVADGEVPEGSELGFTEPNHRFVFCGSVENRFYLRVFQDDDYTWVNLHPTRSEIRQAACDLRSQLDRFPSRLETE